MRHQLGLIFLLLTTALFSTPKKDIEEQHNIAYKLFSSAPEEALTIGKQTEILAKEEGLDFLEANSIFIQAWVYKLRKEQGKSFVLYLKALEILKPSIDEIQNRKLYTTLLRNTGIVLTDHFAYSEAMKCFDEATSLALKDKDYKMAARLFQNKAMANMDQQELTTAHENITKALGYSKLANDQFLELDLLNEKGLVEIELKLFENAQSSFEALLNLTESDSKLVMYQGLAWLNLGYSYYEQEELEQAIQAYNKSEEIWNSNTGFFLQEFRVKSNLSQVYRSLGKIDLAETLAVEASERYDKILLIPEHYEVFDLLSNIYFEKGEYLKSHQSAKKYREENEKFLAHQDEMIKMRDQYKMEILTAGFFLEHNSIKESNHYFILLTIISSIFTILLIAGVMRQHYMKESIKKSLIEIHNKGLRA